MAAARRTDYLPSEERQRLHRRAHRAQQSGHREVCGALVDVGGGKLTLVFLTNRSPRPASWELLRSDLRLAHGVDAKAARVIGTFHSHVVGAALPGPRDIREGFYRRHQLIYDVCGREPKLFRKVRSGKRIIAKEIALVVDTRRGSVRERERRTTRRCS
jgi:proteasome lid subunit RPN8/RPN11